MERRTWFACLRHEGSETHDSLFPLPSPYPIVYRHPETLYGKDNPCICRSSSGAELNQRLAAGLVLERRELRELFADPNGRRDNGTRGS